MLEGLKQIIEDNFLFKPNKNQFRDIERLVFEIIRREKIPLEKIINYLKDDAQINKFSGRNRFFALKKSLIKRRFPLTSAKEKIDTKKVFLAQLKEPLCENWPVRDKFRPLKLFVEKGANCDWLIDNFKKKNPNLEIEELNFCSDYLKKNKFSLTLLKKPIVFLIKESWDFIKACPCTKYHLSCGYWIFNLGFGCPFDCSYCFLQQYTNFPGITLPVNLEDFFEKFDLFLKKLKRPIRIGTGEFCDSLALEEITHYSEKLIPYFKGKNVLFELKTKSRAIDNLLKIKPSSNIIISWSLNPPKIIEREELGTPSLKERIEAAKRVKDAGYRCGFHFDPIIYSREWEKPYKEVVDNLYSELKWPFAWISLGTLRSNRELKTIAELRFPQSNIFYGELLLGEDKKLRYPKFLRKEIYKNMIKWIREHDTKTPVYLCMESKDVWSILGKDFNSPRKIENYILNRRF